MVEVQSWHCCVTWFITDKIGDVFRQMTTAFAIALVMLLLWMSAIDLRSMRIPDVLNTSLACMGFLWAVWSDQLIGGLIGSLVGFSVPLMIRKAHLILRGQQGLGLGDVKFLGAAGLWVGWEGLPILLLIASLSGLLLAMLHHLRNRQMIAHSRIAFGPHLSVGLMVVWIAKVSEMR
jgi:leader peptidase (prepilin peptidase)/N-methyltransferase